MKYVLEVTATYKNIVVEADSFEEAQEIAEMGIVDRWPDVVGSAQQLYVYINDNYPVTTEEGYLGC
jgi:hypothetical protein